LEVEMHYVRGTVKPKKLRLSLCEAGTGNKFAKWPGCDLDVSSLCQSHDNYEATIPLQLDNKEKTVVSMSITSMMLEDKEELRLETLSFAPEGLSTMSRLDLPPNKSYSLGGVKSFKKPVKEAFMRLFTKK
jgi:hypothetical protein